MAKIYFTITGMQYRCGSKFLEDEKGTMVKLVKEPDNEHDREAIKVMMDGLGHIGYVANSPHTVIGESYSAGRLYDKIEDGAIGKVRYVIDGSVLCELVEKAKDEVRF